MADRRVAPPKGSYGGQLRQPVQCIVIHSLEAPARRGMAWSLATGWLQGERVSIHAITDPGESIDMVPLDTVAYHCGGGNQRGVGDEVTGYAAWTRAQWLEPEPFAALRLDARKVAEQAKELGIPLRWLKIAQLRAGERGLCFHNDVRLAFGGTTHTDPGPGFPDDIFLKMCQQWAGETVDPETNPNPKPTGPQTGGAQPEDEDITMYVIHSANRPAVLVDGEDIGILSELLPTDQYGSAVNGLRTAGVKFLNFGADDSAFDAVLKLKGKADLVQVVG